MGTLAGKMDPNSRPPQASADLFELMDPIDDSPAERVMSSPYDSASQCMTDFLKFEDGSPPATPTITPRGSSSQTHSSPSHQRIHNSLSPRLSVQSPVHTRSANQKSSAKKFSRPDHLCSPCSRFFGSREGLESHWINAKCHNWCQRCDHFFNSPSNKMVHYYTSDNHWICDVDKSDFKTKNDLHDHCRIEDNHRCYIQCDKVFDSVSKVQTVSPSNRPSQTTSLGTLTDC